ncbi:MAG TPA: hypothetical protein PLJ18_12090, partial [Niabella sp.]|nr:hypothetical protein [Niabella sp.]
FRFGFAFKNNPFILWPVCLAVDLWPVGCCSFGLCCYGFVPVPLLLGWLGGWAKVWFLACWYWVLYCL